VLSRGRNLANFVRMLSGWVHTVNNLRSTALAGHATLTSGRSDETRRREYHVLADMNLDFVGRRRRSFARIVADKRMPLDVVIREQADAISDALDAAERIWREIKELTAGGYTDECARRVGAQVADFGTHLDVIKTTAQSLVRYIEQTYDNVDLSSGRRSDEGAVCR
jgi:antitoxin component of RelBE/YafQ-DinJ toxin-antitoxin module